MPTVIATSVDICNLALGHLGKPAIVSFTEGTKEANLCNAQYDIARRLVMVKSPWTFARRTETLAEIATNIHSEVWEYAYDVPNSSLKVVRLLEPGQAPNWNSQPQGMYLEAGNLYCSVADARLAYIFNNEDPLSWSPEFADAVALKLAERLAPNVTRRPADVREMRTLYNQQLLAAIETDGQQEVTFYRYGDGYSDDRDTATVRGARQTDGSGIWE